MSDLAKLMREQIFKRDAYTCQRCGAKEGLVVHHLKYPAESARDLMTLCSGCDARDRKPTSWGKVIKVRNRTYDELVKMRRGKESMDELISRMLSEVTRMREEIKGLERWRPEHV